MVPTPHSLAGGVAKAKKKLGAGGGKKKKGVMSKKEKARSRVPFVPKSKGHNVKGPQQR